MVRLINKMWKYVIIAKHNCKSPTILDVILRVETVNQNLKQYFSQVSIDCKSLYMWVSRIILLYFHFFLLVFYSAKIWI